MTTQANNSTIRIPHFELPSGWRWVRLEEVLKEPLKNGLNFRKEDFGTGVKFVNVSDVFCPSIIDTSKLDRIVVVREYFERYKLQTGDILIVRSSLKKEGVAYPALFVDGEEPVVFCGFLIRIRLDKEKVEPFYLLNYLRSTIAREKLVVDSDTVTITNVDQGTLLSLNIPIPPLPEQKRIATKLQALMQQVERARNACEKQLEAAKALPAAYLREVFESGEAKKWERKRLGEVCEIFSGSSAPQEKKYFENGVYPFVRVYDLGKFGRTDNLTDIKDHVNELAIKECNLVKAEKGVILFPKSGAAITTNNRAILGIDAFIVSHLAAIKPMEDITDIYFIYYWLCLTDMVNYMENPGYPSLKLSTISKIPVPLPSIQEQRHIASYLKEKMAQVEKLQSAIKKQLEAINGLPQAYLRKAFRGEL